MENALGRINSPFIQKNTPIKRLGLSRKRKSSGSETSSFNKIQALGSNSPNSITPSNEKQIKANEEDKSIIKSENQRSCDKIDITEDVIKSLKQRITEKENKLKLLKLNRNIESLENLTEIWKTGCKSAYLYLIELIKEKHSEEIDSRTLLNKLGIFKTMCETFESDSEISLSDSSQ